MQDKREFLCSTAPATTDDELDKAETELLQAEADLAKHMEKVRTQWTCYKAQAAEVKGDPSKCIFVLDYTTYELMDREGVKSLGVTVVRTNGHALERKYFDFVDLPIQQRPRDGLYFALTQLAIREELGGVNKAYVWSDAGTGDFHNSPATFAFANLPAVCPQIEWLSLNFFAPRHGWNDCDRHFGSVKRSVAAWMADKASQDPRLMLDIPRQVQLLNSHPNTIAFDRYRPIYGTIVPAIPGLLENLCFKPIPNDANGHIQVEAFRFSNMQQDPRVITFTNAKFVDDQAAERSAQSRSGPPKKKKKRSKAKKTQKKRKQK